jgi:hypothetical protein
MQSGFKTDLNQAYASGAGSFQHMDGTMERVLGSGEALYQSGAGMTMSGGSVKFNVRESLASQISDTLSNNLSLMDSDQRSYSKAQQTTFDRTANYLESLAQRESSGETFDYGKAGEEGRALQQAVNQTKMLHEKYGYSWRQAAEASLKGGLSFTTPTKQFGSGYGVGGSISVDGSLGASNANDQSYDQDTQLARNSDTRVDYNSVVKAASNEQFATSNNIDRSYSDDIRKSYHEQKSLEGQIARRAEEVENYSRALSEVQSKDASYEQDIYHKLEQSIASTYGVSTKDAHDMIENNDARVTPIRQRMVHEEASRLMSTIEHGHNKLSMANTKSNLEEFSNSYESRIDENPTRVIKEHAKNSGLNVYDPEFVANKVEDKVEQLIGKNEQRIEKANAQNEKVANDLQVQINKYEKRRLSKHFGIGGPNNSDNNSDQ